MCSIEIFEYACVKNWQVAHLFLVSPNQAQEKFTHLEYLMEMKNNDNDEQTFLYISLGDPNTEELVRPPLSSGYLMVNL